MNKTDILRDPDLNSFVEDLATKFAEAFMAKQGKVKSLNNLAQETVKENTTSILSHLIKLNKTHDKQDIDFILNHFQSYFIAMALLCEETKQLDY